MGHEHDVLQKLFKMRAALSLSMSSVVGQKASEPNLFDILLMGAPSLSTHPYILSKPIFPPVLVLLHRACVCAIVKAGVVVATVRGRRGGSSTKGRSGIIH